MRARDDVVERGVVRIVLILSAQEERDRAHPAVRAVPFRQGGAERGALFARGAFVDVAPYFARSVATVTGW